MQRCIIIVLDSVGIGALPDADKFGDAGCNTFGHIAESVGGLNLPNMARLGLGNISPIMGVEPATEPAGCYGKMAEVSQGKDTTTGHWEMVGVITERAFPVYPDGFPDDVIGKFTAGIGRKILGNKAASGTEIIKELGEEHMRTGRPIVYTSADSVFQIACHEDIVPVDQLYEWCIFARKMLVSPHNVQRVIARPFIGEPGSFTRTERRKDFSLEPPHETLLDLIAKNDGSVIAIGKINDIYAGRGISTSIHTANNHEGIGATIAAIAGGEGSLVFINLVDFDMLYGHRNDPKGYANALIEFDAALPSIMGAMGNDDILFITADHGCDPTTPGTNHTREYVPLLVYGKKAACSVDLGIRSCFCDLSATIADILSIQYDLPGKSFMDSVIA
ncbi:phosphopentomutase [bacterium]|nr:phosphopentomutase [bacterium]